MYTTFVSCMLTETSVDSIDLMKNDQNHVAGAGGGIEFRLSCYYF